ncbi:hypothetical protein A3H80_00480 [Candidatus Roizmanbacteria bacterium RIFCSPLOWO2_02_FULL_37_19]|uniref:Uncharacterized protein n=1 Tax=Candidatus Roizmanbacteria bacterium RIFCSPHIGHO2_02_FULL_37_24 TaxID=1802037 RepID=A0A1F7GXD4_9BACT|nr:MAG: hypothetical protein A2862_04960 [Candidatus Roizmanbacteria bacterium RIFCSPHIGHO2_01_FULL_38_41]OGK23747.1 MAG: hypothetical protein A3C24_04885 [Candidatus Roizmanbacteria bacterium RIFCSPHIGHO2_02_FULL_37_24]OGK32680.1 MAG: hypothetical protein A3E10_01660 [Candidatus Roizmanbacteria bacterium RIFCSPHIGHO2_12_FULL_37_23]OGK44754.1 MAG: hypothetical protein A2956_01490 [Candidatus Roizmanbacteria bacterium RIFCSPLOWO2_01_FULL_37_57]OGK53994.1 MAG: hypothetical protein A3H80_00480 [Ca
MKIDKKLRLKLKKALLQQIKKPEFREIIVKTPYNLTTEEIKSLKQSIPYLSVGHITNEVDPRILGGLIIIDGSTILDFSVKGRMSQVLDTIQGS